MAVKKHKQKKIRAKKNADKINLDKKSEIDKIFSDFELEINKIKQECNVAVSNFLETFKEKYIKDLKKNINY